MSAATVDDELTMARAALCDLLLGRRLRGLAQELFQRALLDDAYGLQDLADDVLASAAHLEWVAVHCERGQILWGGRLNRCGYQVEREECP